MLLFIYGKQHHMLPKIKDTQLQGSHMETRKPPCLVFFVSVESTSI